MKRPKDSLLFHPFFLLSLAVLLANDLYWKYEYHNWLTGKLSDIVGLIVLPVFCRAVFPKLSKIAILLSCALLFIWWKSSLSQPVLDALIYSFALPVHRVVDTTDLLALFVLPVGFFLQPVALPAHKVAVYCLRWGLGLVVFTSLCSTSMYRPLFMAYPNSDDIYFGESFTQKRSAAAVLETLQAKQVAYHLDSVVYYPVVNQHELYYRSRTENDTTYNWQKVSQAADSTLYVRQKGHPYYLIPLLKTENRTFRNVRFTLSENKDRTKTRVTIQMFLSDGVRGYIGWDSKTKKAYKKMFEEEVFSSR